jgi:hypothetical protein
MNINLSLPDMPLIPVGNIRTFLFKVQNTVTWSLWVGIMFISIFISLLGTLFLYPITQFIRKAWK